MRRVYDDDRLLDVPWVPVDSCVRIQSACCRSCRGHSKDGPQVAGQRHVETVAATGCNATRYQWLLQKSLPWGLSVRDHRCDSTTLSTLFSPFLYCYGPVSIGQVLVRCLVRCQLLSVFELNLLDRKEAAHGLFLTSGFPAFGPHFEPPRVDRQGIHSFITSSPRTLSVDHARPCGISATSRRLNLWRPAD